MERGPDPAAAQSPAEFMELMRLLRRWADLSYRQLERNAADAGDVLPRATISAALSRNDLPREELLAAYVRACGADDDTVSAWLDARRRLSISPVGTPPPAPAEDSRTAVPADDDTPPGTPQGDKEAPDEEQAPATGPAGAADSGPADDDTSPPRAQSNRRRHGPLVAITALTVAGVLTLALWPHDDRADDNRADSAPSSAPPSGTAPRAQSEQPTASPTASRTVTAEDPVSPVASPDRHEEKTSSRAGSPPASAQTPVPARLPATGWTSIHPASSASLCLTEGRERNGRTDREIAVQHPCADAPLPRVYLQKLGRHTYRIQWHHPDADKGIGCLTVDDGSTSPGTLLSPAPCADSDSQTFRLEASGGGFRLRPLHSGLCVGFLPPATDGAEAVQTACTGGSAQAFTFTAG
ncbi:RICIN domain-containing protein [Streptomyces sp. SudanB182_2057]|uniref:RICIN domain-containing protein n=1 Tax=Streptomyces sp. SudanB182_2057 TaxID=3035281 RepID=UPI003F54E590